MVVVVEKPARLSTFMTLENWIDDLHSHADRGDQKWSWTDGSFDLMGRMSRGKKNSGWILFPAVHFRDPGTLGVAVQHMCPESHVGST